MPAEKETARLEAFSDGVFAIAITLLVLEIKVPYIPRDAGSAELWNALGKLWPSYLAYFITFGAILIMWINHHDSLKMLHKISRPFIYANGLLLLLMTFFPFPTALLAEYITAKSNSAVVVFYCAYHLLVNITYNIMTIAMEKPVYLPKPEISKEILKKLKRIHVWGCLFTRSPQSFPFGFPSPGWSLIVCFGWFGLPCLFRRGRRHKSICSYICC